MLRREELEQTLRTLAAELEDQELHVLAWLANRLLHGQRTYGALNLLHDRRDFEHEGAEELADFALYSAMREVRRILARKAA